MFDTRYYVAGMKLGLSRQKNTRLNVIFGPRVKVTGGRRNIQHDGFIICTFQQYFRRTNGI
jgi:hypothetical protein